MGHVSQRKKTFYNSRVPIKQFHISRKTIDSNKNNTIIIQVFKSMFNACYSVLSGCLTKNHAERFKLKIRFPLYFYHELPLSLKVLKLLCITSQSRRSRAIDGLEILYLRFSACYEDRNTTIRFRNKRFN